MARQLWLLRHGEAEPHGARPDAERRLTDRGEAQSRAAGRALVALGVTFQAVLASPKVRAWDTATLACEALGNEVVEHRALAQGFGARDAWELLHATGQDERLLLVGHNPDLAQTVHDLTGALVDFKKGGVAAIRTEGGSGHLIPLLRPRELERIG
jgi:phosphohistidine phosphatase